MITKEKRMKTGKRGSLDNGKEVGWICEEQNGKYTRLVVCFGIGISKLGLNFASSSLSPLCVFFKSHSPLPP